MAIENRFATENLVQNSLDNLTSCVAFIDTENNETVTDAEISGGDITVDSVLSTSSVNPVQNKVVTSAINQLSEQIDDYGVTPQMFGAKGDGVTDDTKAINDALASGKSLHFPEGEYLVTSALIVPVNCVISGVAEKSIIRTNIPDGYVLKGRDANGNISATLQKITFENLYFENMCEQDTVTMMQSGNFVEIVDCIYMVNCRVNRYANVFDTIKLVSRIVNSRFTTIYQSFARVIYDSFLIGNYISASVYGAPYGSKCFSYQFYSSTLSNNFIDYFYDCFAAKHLHQAIVTGNTFSRIVNVFHDSIASMTVSGNSFSEIRYTASDWANLTAEQQDALMNERWCVIKFDNQVIEDTHMMCNLNFVDNVSDTCDNFIYVADGVKIIASNCDFRGNKITQNTRYVPSIVDAGFYNVKETEASYQSFKNVYFDFWDMKEYEELPSPTLYGSAGKSVKSFPFMRAICNGETYININGVWKKYSDAFPDPNETVNEPFVTPQMFGARANGSSDDTQAINNALASGKSVYFPKGKYYITSALIVPNYCKITGSGRDSIIRTAITEGFVFNGIDANGNITTTLNWVEIDGLRFLNWLSQDTDTHLYNGDFIDKMRISTIRNCYLTNYNNIFYGLYDRSMVTNNFFDGICGRLASEVYDSTFDNNQINAPMYAVVQPNKCINKHFSKSAFINNFVSGFYDVFCVTYISDGRVIGNTFSDNVNVFHDELSSLTIANNVIVNCKYVASKWTNLTEEQKATLEAEKWCFIRIDNQTKRGIYILRSLSVANNVSASCDNYIYIADGVDVIASNCEFRGNKMTKDLNGTPTEVDAGFRNWTTTVESYQSFKNVYFDFWDMKEYEELPSPTLLVNTPKAVVSFPFMRAICNNELYININGTWKCCTAAVV